MGRAVLREFWHEGEQWMLVAYERPRPAALAALTASELEVLDLWLEGSSMREIASARGVTVRTIAKQVASLYEKLRVSSREELVVRIHELAEELG
jgi:DNA-binding CsgD family transcriptional regulator